MSTFGEKIKDLRKEKKLTQKEMAKALSVTVSTLSHWECDYQEPSFKDLALLANHFDVSTDYLLGLEDDFGVKKYTAPTITQKPITLEENQLLNNYRTLPNDLKHLVERYVADVTRIYHDEVETKKQFEKNNF